MAGRALTDGIDSQHVQPRVATYRNAYGAHFMCTTTCYFVLMTYLIMLASALVILFLIPVTSPSPSKANSKPQSPPFLLWFGSDDKKDHGVAEPEVKLKPDVSRTKRRGFWSRLVAVWRGNDRELPVTDTDDLAASAQLLSKHKPVVVIPEELHRTGPVKTYESIGVDTEDLSQPPSSPTGRRGSIFANAPPPPKRPTRHRIPRTTTNDLHASGAVSFGASETSFFSDMALVSRVDTTRGLSEILGDGGTQLVRTIERRASIRSKVEKRKEQAKSDISYENLRDEEIQMYEYLEFVRELLEGMVIKKLCQKSAKVVKRTFYITKDMTTVYWSKLGSKKWIKKKSSLEPGRIDKVLKGFHGNANVETKGKSEKSSLYVSVVCSDGKRLDLEAKDEAMRQRIYVGFSRLAAEKRQQQQRRQHGQLADAMTSPMAAAPAQVAPPPAFNDGEEEEKPPSYATASIAARSLTPERREGRKDPEDTRAHEEPRNFLQAKRRDSTTGLRSSLKFASPPRLSSALGLKHDLETETVGVGALHRGDLEEKDGNE